MKDKFLAIIIVFYSLSCLSQDLSKYPNILWIVSEDNSPFIGAYNDDFATTPNIDKFAKEGILYENAFSVAPVCSPTRSTLITGVYSSSMGTEHMRSKYPIPDLIRFFPEYLRKAGYYTTNNVKTDYNTSSENERMLFTWDESSRNAHYKNRNNDQPFFAVFNITTTHESSIFKEKIDLKHDPEKVDIPPYLPRTKEMKHDWAYYYDNIEKMDEQVGALLNELEELGLSENTIVYYYSDHGGILGRSKQYLYDSGLHVPLIIRVPPKYQHLAPLSPGSRTDRLVSFVDFAPTVLSLANIEIPKYMEGMAFLGVQSQNPRKYVYSFRGRMDERNDLSRGVRSKKFFYRKNFMPHRIYGQHIQYHWMAPSIRSWEKAFKNHELNEVQSKYWGRKEYEELYDVESDPHNINNLAKDPKYLKELEEMRKIQSDWSIKYKDAGFIPEVMMEELSEYTTTYEYARTKDYQLEKDLSDIEKMINGDIITIEKNINSNNSILRYWASVACSANSKNTTRFKSDLIELLSDNNVAIATSAAEALYEMGDKDLSIKTLVTVLKDKNISSTLNAMDVMEVMGMDAKPALQSVKDIIMYNQNKMTVFEIRASAVRLMENLSNK